MAAVAQNDGGLLYINEYRFGILVAGGIGIWPSKDSTFGAVGVLAFGWYVHCHLLAQTRQRSFYSAQRPI